MSYALDIQNLSKTYDNDFVALKGVSLKVEPGEFYALLGPNGAGKSTTLGIVSSLINKTSGSVSIFGYDLATQLVQAKTMLGVVPQEINFNQFEKVRDILITQAGYYGIPASMASNRVDELLKQLGLWDKRSEQARMLSGGMKRRLMIARALVHEPKLLILDEPTAGVDIELRRSMWDFLQMINAQGTTIILTTHYLEEAEALCRRIAIIDKGEILEDTDKRSLLSKLDKQVFVMETMSEIATLPDIEGFSLQRAADGTVEVEVSKSQSMNELFDELNKTSLEVASIRSKSNRLEELFVEMVRNNQSDTPV